MGLPTLSFGALSFRAACKIWISSSVDVAEVANLQIFYSFGYNSFNFRFILKIGNYY